MGISSEKKTEKESSVVEDQILVLTMSVLRYGTGSWVYRTRVQNPEL